MLRHEWMTEHFLLSDENYDITLLGQHRVISVGNCLNTLSMKNGIDFLRKF